jgi:hypothetical protein
MTHVLMGTLIAFVITTVGTAAAKEVSIKGHRPSQVKAACKGVFAPPSAANGSYGCLNKNGSGIYCGGDTPAQKQTCSTFLVASPAIRPMLNRLNASTR